METNPTTTACGCTMDMVLADTACLSCTRIALQIMRRTLDEQKADVERLRSEIARCRAMSTWQPMRIAPRDGTRVLLKLYNDPRGKYLPVCDGWWEDEVWDSDEVTRELHPVAWAPMPEVPA